MPSKLNWLIQSTAPGSLVLQAWLTEHDISPQLAQKYVKNGWLEKLRSGVYVRPGKTTQWFNAVSCLIDQLNFPVHLAGLTSLNHQGKAHYLQLKETTIWLEVPPRKVLPLWFKEFGFADWLLVSNSKLKTEEPSELIEIEVGGTKLKASRPELAAFELLGAVPAKISFEHAAEVFQGLTNLSPRKVQSLLNRSKTIKTNRLFLFLANYYQHPWFSRIDETQINLGSGKRQIVAGGVLDQHYQITVPDSYLMSKNAL